jgi:hypothetical protein
MLVHLKFWLNGSPVGESQAGYIPHKGMTIRLENALLPGDTRFRVASEPEGTFTSRGTNRADVMRPGPVHIVLVPAAESTDAPPVLHSQSTYV